jgi:hypothetical protein
MLGCKVPRQEKNIRAWEDILDGGQWRGEDAGCSIQKCWWLGGKALKSYAVKGALAL